MAATSICVAIMDEGNWASQTDVMVIVDGRRRRLTWVPRDLWSPLCNNRLNKAFARGQLLPALAELGFACDGLLCLRRDATIAALATVEVEVPVTWPLDFWYPLEPLQPIEHGRKQVSFRPPSERLSGERLHQWIGARYAVTGRSSDLHRLGRQITLLRALLRQHADFALVLSDPERVRIEGDDPLPVLATVDSTWTMRVFDRVRPATVRQILALRKSSWGEHLLDRSKDLVARLLRGRRG